MHQVLSYDDLRGIADKFLSEQWSSGRVPIDIEEIIDVNLGIDIQVMVALKSVCSVDAFLGRKLDTIYIDAEVYGARGNRCRFSLAHELSHLILHKDIISKLEFNTLKEWKKAIDGIPEESYRWIEWQAYALAGLLLVPPAALAKAVGELPDLTDQASRHFAIADLAKSFAVSVEVAEKRLKYDNLLQ